ncbi:ATP-binding protein [Actinomadura kijaniata]|uniref:ATP-binding protein n=1 Tax=Actinomadura kijaniata TaxID=46161 RepID=UPI000B30AF1B|nr:ATP-binding protein [Actinomadura kijaniata]
MTADQGRCRDGSSLVVAAMPEAVRTARDFTARWFLAQGFSGCVTDAARLVVTELVTNAYRHGSGPGDKIFVRLHRAGSRAVVEVGDGSDAWPVVRPFGLDEVDGRGLAMVEIMAESWGVAPLADGGKIVHAVLRG